MKVSGRFESDTLDPTKAILKAVVLSETIYKYLEINPLEIPALIQNLQKFLPQEVVGTPIQPEARSLLRNFFGPKKS